MAILTAKPPALCARLPLGAWLLAVALALPGRAQSDDTSTTLPIERYRPALGAGGLGTTEGGQVVAHLGWDAGLVLDYALNPLVLRDANGVAVAPIVAHRLGGHLLGSLGLFEYFSLGVDLPVTLLQLGGELPDGVGEAIGLADGITTVGIGDLRLAPKVRLLREDKHAVSVAITPALTVPTAGGVNVESGAWDYGGGFLGEGPGRFAFIPEVAVSTNLSGVRAAANLAYRLRQPSRYLGALQISPEIVYRLGVGYDLGAVAPPLGHTLVFVELHGATSDNNPFGLLRRAGLNDEEQRLADIERRLTNPLEWALGVRYATPLAGLHVEGGIGAGILPGFGTPDVRALLGVRFAFEDRDRDDDGIEDDVDRCAEAAEDQDGHDDGDGCPDPDDDGDGIPDAADACPDQPEDSDRFQDGDGCAEPDNDGDGVLDTDDRCPLQAGSPAFQGCPAPDRDGDGVGDPDDACVDVPGDPTLLGCPDQDGDGIADALDSCPAQAGPTAAGGCPDADADAVTDTDDRCPSVSGSVDLRGCADLDQDGIADPDDRCPDQPETINGVDDGDGCPDQGKSLVVVTAERIELKETVFFNTGKDTIQKKSFPLLDQVALVLKAHAEIKRVSVEGHTDDQGPEANNLELSQRRAASVVRYLVAQGVDEARLQSDGFGESQPIAPNTTKAGREQNRRVEMKILPQ